MSKWLKQMVFDKLVVTTVREGLGSIQKSLSDLIMSSLNVHSSEPMYTTLYLWLKDQPASKKCKKTRLLNLEGKKITGPSYGKYSIWYKGVVIWVTIAQEKGNQCPKGFNSSESITLSTVVPKAAVLQEIIQEVTNQYEKKVKK